ncbi:hypothetical protein MMC26_006412 [Xylographa opegraphella]|nr:hypothetical protein [Xylographa opegraphella]
MAMALDAEPFTLVESTTEPPTVVSGDFKDFFSGKSSDLDVHLTKAIRRDYPNHTLSIVPVTRAINLLAYAYSGNAAAALDTSTEDIIRWRSWQPGFRGQPGELASSIRFAKYNYTWLGEKFVMYWVPYLNLVLQYIVHECAADEKVTDQSRMVDELIKAIGEWSAPDDKFVYVYDSRWVASRALYDEIHKSSWDDVILDDVMKKTLTDIVGNFFDSKDVYDELGVPWKRGVIFHGPAGNGKTVSIKAIMNTLATREKPIDLLYVKSAPSTFNIRDVFTVARNFAPCLLVLEDIDTIVTSFTRSYFFNEVDGLERNDGIMMVASTNHLDQLDPGLSKRPSRFDRKYFFPNPSQSDRTLYCEYWRTKLRSKPSVHFPKKLCPAMARIMEDFSFAYMKEAFVSTLLVMANNRTDKGLMLQSTDGNDDGSDDDLDDYELWREMKKQVALLREDMGSANPSKALTEEHVGPGPDDLAVNFDTEGKPTISTRPMKGLVLDQRKFPAQFMRDSEY